MGIGSSIKMAWRTAALLLVALLFLTLAASPAAARCEDGGGNSILAVYENNASTATVIWSGYTGVCDHIYYSVVWVGGGGKAQQTVPISQRQSSLSGLRRGTVYTVAIQGCALFRSSGCGPWIWKKFVSCGTRAFPCGHPRLNPPEPVNIVSKSGLCLDVHAPDQLMNGARVQVWTCNGTAQQTWVLDRAVGAVISLAGKCLDVHAPDRFTNGGRMQVWDCNRQQQQHWGTPRTAYPRSVIYSGPITNAGGKCLDVHAPDQFKNGARVQVWNCNNTMQQDWRVVEAR